MLSAGRLNKRVTIEKPNEIQDATGQPIPNWEAVATVWASIVPNGSREPRVADAYTPTNSARITIRYRCGILPSYRVKYGTRIYAINGITDPNEAHESLVLDVAEVI